MRPLPTRTRRVLAGLGLGLGFLVMASVFAPDLSRAALEDSSDSIDAAAGLPHLGSLHDSRFRIEIYGGDMGPLYSVFDASTGASVGALLTADEVAEWFPRIDLPGIQFDRDTAIMRAEPEPTPFD